MKNTTANKTTKVNKQRTHGKEANDIKQTSKRITKKTNKNTARKHNLRGSWKNKQEQYRQVKNKQTNHN